METLFLYLICFVSAAILVAGYFLCRFVFFKNHEKKETILKWILRGVAILSFTLMFLTFFHNKGAMLTGSLVVAGETVPGYLDPEIGCLNLVGVPYGANKVGNFFAWFSIAMLYPGALLASLVPFWEFKAGKILSKYIQLPIIGLEAITLFNVVNAITGSNAFTYNAIFIASFVGVSLALSVIQLFTYLKDDEGTTWKDYLFAGLIFVTIWICCLPPNTLSTLFNPNLEIFGRGLNSLRVKDFKIAHRIYFYIALIFPTAIYFVYRDCDFNTRKVVLIAASIGALIVFSADFSAYDMFPRAADGTISVNVNSLPIHLCHTALYIVPICVAFNFKRLFYFTYFINVFGAVVAMMFPNVGDNLNPISYSVVLFWYNHISAYSAPLLCVALGVFERAKFKQMLWSLLFFLIYFIIIMLCNSFLSVLVSGYDPNVIGSGTDYLFINGDYVVSTAFGNDGVKLLGFKLTWNIGDKTCVIYPLYQSLFFIGYVAIAFGMWFVYSLFFRIAGAHIDIHNQLVIRKKLNITFKEKLEMDKINNAEIDHSIASLKFEHFSKRYGSSTKLSANDVTFEVKGGEIFGFLGPNGAGKSTCIKTAIGIQPVTEGNIYVCGYDVMTQSVKSKRYIGYVPDHYALYEKLTGREYINYIADLYGVSKEERDERISYYIELFELTQAFDNKMQTYSHGMKQKIAIIAALIHEPKVWILDEPLTGLDPQSIFQVKECMKNHAKKGNIVFFSSHLIDVVEKLCTKIAVIKKGEIIYQAEMSQVLVDHPEGLENFYMQAIKDNGDLDED